MRLSGPRHCRLQNWRLTWSVAQAKNPKMAKIVDPCQYHIRYPSITTLILQIDMLESIDTLFEHFLLSMTQLKGRDELEWALNLTAARSSCDATKYSHTGWCSQPHVNALFVQLYGHTAIRTSEINHKLLSILFRVHTIYQINEMTSSVWANSVPCF